MLNDDDDDQLLQLEQDLGEGYAYDHVQDAKADKEGCSFNSYLQGLLYHFVAKPIVKYRWVVLGMYQWHWWVWNVSQSLVYTYHQRHSCHV